MRTLYVVLLILPLSGCLGFVVPLGFNLGLQVAGPAIDYMVKSDRRQVNQSDPY